MRLRTSGMNMRGYAPLCRESGTSRQKCPNQRDRFQFARVRAQSAGDDTLAATAEINLARLSSQRNDEARVAALLNRAVARLEAAAPSYNRGL
ncbi:MAG: hypothetical protein ACRDQZ_13990, partial [Mycobacteriales bacterium]